MRCKIEVYSGAFFQSYWGLKALLHFQAVPENQYSLNYIHYTKIIFLKQVKFLTKLAKYLRTVCTHKFEPN